MASPKTLLLNKAEEDLIHEKSIECLKEVGVRVDSEFVLELLEKRGASVDYEDHIAKITEKMINEALEAAPKKILLYGRDLKNDLELPVSTYPYSAMNGCALFVTDKDTDGVALDFGNAEVNPDPADLLEAGDTVRASRRALGEDPVSDG